MERGILISPEVIKEPELVGKLSKIENKHLGENVVINKEFLRKIGLLEKEAFAEYKVLTSYDKDPGKINVNDFVGYFNKRFETLSTMLRQRQELQNPISINRIKMKNDREPLTIIGMILDKKITKNNNVMITLEDPTGTTRVIVNERKKEMYELARNTVLDEVIGVEGTSSGNFVFANQVIIPDVPLIKELKKSPEEEFLVILGDPHFGSNAFLQKEFDDFIDWINQRKGNPEQKEIASKVKYLVLIGDLVEGVGIYPNQEQDLEIKDVQEQYEKFTKYLSKIPTHITLFVCPGNHDAGRISEPQPALLHKYTETLRNLPNVVLISNPALINIGAKKEFSGFDVLLYHGYSLIYYADNIESIRAKGGQKRPDLIMKALLQKRHLAPTHTSNLYVPDTEKDPLIIETIPDFFITGHIHRVSVSNYKNITLINGSCWTRLTEDQEKRGLENQPAKLPVINLKTREVKIINFLKEGREKENGSEGVDVEESETNSK